MTAIASDSSDRLELRNATLEMPSVPMAERAARIAASSNRTSDRHVVVRLASVPTDREKAELERDGLRLVTCVAPTVWIASTKPSAVETLDSIASRLVWIGTLPTEAKIHPFLAAGRIPDWTVAKDAIDAFMNGREFDIRRLAEQIDTMGDPEIAIYAIAHADVDLGDFEETIAMIGGKVRSRITTVNGLMVRLRMSAVDRLAMSDDTLWIEPALPPLETNNESNRMNTQVDEVREAPYGLDGSGVTVMVYDGGFADASHPDFGGRLTVRDSSGQSSHATHVSGTVGGDGSNSGGTNAGMAPGVTIESYGFEQEGGLSEGFLYTDPGDLEADYADAILNHGAVVANNSIGTNTAPNGFPCEWTGDYGVTSNLIDSVVRGGLGAPIRIVWANGNERQTDRCGEFFNTTAPPACAKNHITVGATNSNDDSITSFTSWGPSDDGRIKPDITAPGCQSDGDNGVTSTVPGGGYSSYCGTSMASPTATGIAALIIQDWRQRYPDRDDIRNSSLKALLANSGDDLGNPGPDCQYGFGTIRARQAIDALRSDAVIENEIADGDVAEYLVIVEPGDPELRVTLAWDDAPATPLAATALVNDLDLVVTDPAGNRWFSWTIDPSDPGAPATRSGEDRRNNMEQVSVQAPAAGAWRIRIRGHAVPVGPQEYGLAASPSPTSCSSTGIVGFGRSFVRPETIVPITVVDCDLNTDDDVTNTIAVDVWSDDDPLGFQTVLTEVDPAAANFLGSVELTSDPDGFGLHAVDGSTIYVRYRDANDAGGGTDVVLIDTAIVDGMIEAPTSVEAVDFGADYAAIRVVSDEPVRVSVMYGLSCDNLAEETSSSSFSSDQTIVITGLEDTFTYYFRITLTDAAGNVGEYGNGPDCFEFTVPDAIDYFAEQFSGGFDLAYTSLRFIPIESADVFAPCSETATALPVDPSGGVTISLGDDASESISLPFEFPFYGESWDSVYVGSNGYLTFGASDTGYNESIASHFSLPRISALFDDLNPSTGGVVSYRDLGSRFAVSWVDVNEYGTSNQNTFQVVLHATGEIEIGWQQVDVTDAVVGLSDGSGVQAGFIPADFSDSGSGCLPRPPVANDLSFTMGIGDSVEITLSASDDGPLEALFFSVDSLPQRDLRDLATGALITTVPHVVSGSGPHLRMESNDAWEGVAEFVYHADDGGTPPDGGPSGPAIVTVVVSSGPQVVHRFDFDVDPGWETEGAWAFGQPTGQGGAWGSPDPTSGATGDFVYGYNLNGDYENGLAEINLTTTPIDCSNVTGTTLRFQRWLGVESASYDHAAIEISVGDGPFAVVWDHAGGSSSDSEWVEVEYDISAVADGRSNVRIRWVMGTTDGSVVYCGWNIDDVEIIGVVPNEVTPGDLNGDGLVNGADMGLMLVSWGPCPGCPADLNGDGVVDGADMGLLLTYWSSGFARSVAVEDRDQPRGEDPQEVEIQTDPRLVNRDLLVVADHDGLVVSETGYRQEQDARLVIEIDGEAPILDHDLMVVRGESTLAGVLEIRVADHRRLASGIFVVLVSDSMVGAFDSVEMPTGTREDVRICASDHAILIVVGEIENGVELGDARPSGVDEVLDLIDVMHGIVHDDAAWDLDGNGLTDTEDLRILLDRFIGCD